MVCVNENLSLQLSYTRGRDAGSFLASRVEAYLLFPSYGGVPNKDEKYLISQLVLFLVDPLMHYNVLTTFIVYIWLSRAPKLMHWMNGSS